PYRHNERNTPALIDGWKVARLNSFKTKTTDLSGDWVFAHPKILQAMASAFATAPGKDFFVKTSLKQIAKSHCWPASAYLELAAYQLRGFVDAPWRNWNSYLDTDNSEAVISLKTLTVNSFLAMEVAEWPFFWMDHTLPLEERIEATNKIIASLHSLDSDASDEIRWLFEASQNSFKVMELCDNKDKNKDQDTPILWMEFFKNISLRDGFLHIAQVVYLLIWILMGPKYCATMTTSSGVKKTPGQLRWSKCPDAIILRYLEFARRTKTAQQEHQHAYTDYTTPDTHTVDLIYAEVCKEHLEKLYQSAAFLLKNGTKMAAQLREDLGDWLSEDPAKFPAFHGHPTPAHHTNIIYNDPPEGLEHRSVAAFSRAVDLATRTSLWQTLLYEVLQVDLLFIDDT
ncbi:hypothetical protein BD309DRAFT_878983, partial [Dichomitus squalens]